MWWEVVEWRSRGRSVAVAKRNDIGRDNARATSGGQGSERSKGDTTSPPVGNEGGRRVRC